MRACLTAVAALALCWPAEILAQERPPRSIGILLSHSISSSSATAAESGACLCAQSRDVLEPVSVSSIELEWALPLRGGRAWGLEYGLRAPLALVRNNPLDAATMNGTGGWTMSLDTPRASTFGLGIKPAGLRVWAGSERVRAEADVAAGVVYFGSPALASNAKRFNFVYDFGIGVRVGFRGAQVAFGFRRHHLSNAGLGEVNPGLDSRMGYVGVWLD